MIVFLGDPSGRPPTATKRSGSRRVKIEPETHSLPSISDRIVDKSGDRGEGDVDNLTEVKKTDAEIDYEKFKSTVDERRRVFVDNRNRSISANKQSTMFDSWSASDLHAVSAVETVMEGQQSDKLWKGSANVFLVSKASYDSIKANNSYKSARGKSPLLMSELFHQHRHQNPRASESLLFLKRPFTANPAKMPADLTALANILTQNDFPDFNASSSTTFSQSGKSSNVSVSRMDSFASIFSGQDDSKTRLPRPRTSTGILHLQYVDILSSFDTVVNLSVLPYGKVQ